MKIVLTTTFLVTVLATGIVGINNVFAQGNNNDMIGNDTTMTMNATLPTTIISNAILAYAQEEEGGMMGNDTMSMENDTSMMIMNATLPMSLEGNDTAKPMNTLTN